MALFFLNIFLALIWSLALGKLSLTNLLIGFLLGYAALWVAHPPAVRPGYFGRVRQTIGLVCFFLWELILANIRVAHDVLRPKYHMRPGIVAIPLDAETDMEITMLAALITVTPGSLSLFLSEDHRVLYVHAMFIDDVESFRQSVKRGFERRLLELVR